MADRTIVTRMRVEYKQAVDGINAVGTAADKAADKIESSGKKSESAFSQMAKQARDNEQAWTTAGTALTAVGGGITAIGLAAMKTGIEYNTLQQTSRAAMKTLMGGAEQANRQMDRLDAFAKNSPFSKQVFIQAQQQLVGFGAEARKVVPYLEAIQDAVAATGGSNEDISGLVATMSKIQSSAKVTAEDLNEFGNRGVDAAGLIGSQMGKTGAQIREDITSGSLDAGKALDALTAGMSEKFGGAAANVKNTFEGALDRVKAAWRDLSASMAEPLVGKNGGGLGVAALNKFADALRAFEDIPAPVRNTGLALGGLAGGASLAAGGFLLLAPRIVETQAAFATLAGQGGVIGSTARGLGKLSPVLATAGKVAGVAAAGYTALGVAAKIASDAVAEGEAKTSQSYFVNLVSGSKGAEETLKNIDKGFQGISKASANGFTSVDSFGDALNRIFNPQVNDNINDFTGTIFQSFGAVSGSQKARDAIKELDGALVELTTSGAPEKAQAAFAGMWREAQNQGVEFEELMSVMPQYRDSIVDLATAAKMGSDEQTIMKIATGQVSPEMLEQAEAAGASEEAIEGVATASRAAAEELEKARQAVINSADGFLDFATKAKDAKVTTEEWINDLEKQILAQERWVANLEELKNRGASQELLDQLIALGVDGAKRVDDLANGSQDSIDRLNSAFKSGKANADNLADGIVNIPDADLNADSKDLDAKLKAAEDRLDNLGKMRPTPYVKAETKKAKEDIAEIKRQIQNIKDKTVSINLATTGYGWNLLSPEGQKRAQRQTRIDLGLEKPKPGQGQGYGIMKATGGRVIGPGSGTSDDIPAMLSNGEHVWTAEEVRKAGGHGVIEAMRAAVMSGNAFASGGAVGSAERRLADAQRRLDSISSRGQKRSAEDVRRDRAQARVDAARDALDRAKEAEARRERVSSLQSDLRVDVRRGSIRDQVTGGLSGGYSAVDRLFSLGGNEDLSRGSRSKANSSARKFEANLTSLYAQAERIDERLKKAQDKAQELKGIKDSVTSSLLGGRDLDVGTTSTMVNGQWQTSSNLGQAAKGLRMDVGAMRAFAGKLKKLVELGVPGSIVQEIAQAGVAEGSNMADSFLDATAAERKSYLGAWSDYEKYANQAGQYVTEGFHKGGSAAADGVVKGLEGKQKNVESAIASLAKAMESTFKQVLGIHSPSRVMSELGGFTAEGLVQGMLGGVTDVQSAAMALGAAAVPGMVSTDMAFNVSANPVVEDDEGMAGLAMQDMSATTLDAMEQMQFAVSEGFAGMLANTQTAQAAMLADTQLNQTGMLTATQASNLGQLTDTQVQQAAMLLNTQTQNAAMLLNTQTQQEAMRLSVEQKQIGQRTVMTNQQEAMRLMLIDKQSQMKIKSAEDFESLKHTTGLKFSAMRTATDTTMSSIYGDYDTRLGDLKGLNKRGFESILSTSKNNMEGVRDGIDAQMRAAKPEMGGRLNDLIGVLSKFTDSVNKAFGDVGVKLKSPKSLNFATGGVLPGYTPGRDVHDFYSPTAGNLHLSGGEAIMRPEFVKAVGGSKAIDRLNREAIDGKIGSDSDHFYLGGMVPDFAFAKGGTLSDAAKWWQSKGARITEFGAWGQRVGRHSKNSLHYSGRAFDANYGPGGTNSIEQGFFDRMIPVFKPQFPGVRIIWRAPGHFNHAHFDNGGGADIGNTVSGSFSHPFLDRAGVKPGDNMQKAYVQAAKKLTTQIYDKHSRQLPDGIAGQLGKGIMSQVSEGLIGKAKEYGKTTAVSGTTAGDPAVKAAVRKIAEQMGWGKYWGDIDWLVNKESTWNPNAANPSSSARGLFQKMTSLHGPVEDTVEGQARWGLNYIKSTYGNPAAARRHHERSNWYESGSVNAKSGWAVVGEDGPELINLAGGEQVHNASQTRKLLAENRTFIPNQRNGFDQAALVNAVSSAIQSGGVSAESLAAALDGVRMTFQADGQQFTGAVTAVIGNGYDESRSRLAKSSQKIGAR